MDDDTNDAQKRQRRAKAGRSGVLACALVGIGLLAAACSGGSPPKVASLGATTTTPAASAGGSSGGDTLAKLRAYSGCMRSHGIADFPDPSTNPDGTGGGLSLSGGPGSDLNRDNPQFKAANQACQSLMPSQTPANPAQAVAGAVKLAACMRTHGFPSFPDPDSQGAFNLSGIDMNLPQVQSAFTTCRTLTKFHGPIGVHSSGSG